MSPRVLVVDDEGSVGEQLATILSAYDVTTASDGARALALLASEPFDVVVTDVRTPGADGFAVLEAARRLAGGPEVVLVSAHATIADAVAAMRSGAYDYVAKPFDPDDVSLVVAHAVERCHRARDTAAAAARPDPAGEVDASGPFRQAVDAARDRASRAYLVALMRDFQGCVSDAAEHAGMERVSLHRLLRRYGVHSEEFKHGG